jgi:hypothetical protein
LTIGNPKRMRKVCTVGVALLKKPQVGHARQAGQPVLSVSSVAFRCVPAS